MKTKKNFVIQAILWVIQGFIVGIGAILPGVSGGTLCYAFGMYDPNLDVLSSPIKGIRKHWFKLIFFVIGGGIGFVGLSGVTAFLLGKSEALVMCAFAGLVLGTIPDIWRESGERGRNKFSILSLIISFAAITVLFFIFKNVWHLSISPNLVGWILCGLLWGLSFIIPGFSSSTLLLFFGIYESMSLAISRLDFSVLIPLGITMLLTLLLFSRIMKFVFDKYYSITSHCVLGFVLATTLMIIPKLQANITLLYGIIALILGAVASYFFTLMCEKIKKNTDNT